MLLLFAAVPAHADEVQLRGQMVVAAAPSLVGPAQRGSQWTWLTLREPRALAAMPADWLLQTDQVRFERVRVIAVADNGAVQDIALGAHQLEANWAAGGVMQFGIAAPGRSIRQLSIGFERLDDPGLFRKVTAMDPATAASHQVRWLLLMGLFAGLLIASFAYKLLFTTRRLAFRRWYLGWVAASLAYGLIWSNVAAYLVPGLAGPPAIRAAYILVSLTVTLGSLFLLSVLEDGKVPPRLRSAVKAIALVCVALGVVAANETWMAAGTSDLLFNLALVACVGVSFAAIVLAALRGSRVVWLYLAGWSPVIAVFAARAARNFGLMAQSDAIDMATFVAIALESLVFSVVVLDRFHTLRKERDAAEASARGMEIERQTLRRAAHSDFLTGLGNRASFHEELRVLFDTPAAARGAFTLYLIDIDYLKDVNDRHGHDCGDALLRQVGRSLAALTDGRTSCARIGGDEFAVLCCHDAGMERPLAREIERLQGQTWAHDTRSGTVSLSVGSATARSARSPAELFRQADIALYEAKRLGRGCHQPFDERLRRQVENDRELIDDAHAGLGRGEFVLYYQPIVALRDRRRVGVEALLRWNHPRRGLLGPNAFAGVLADREIGSAVQRRVLKLAIEELRRWPADAGTLGVNLTSLDLSGAAAAHKVLRQLAAAGVPPAALCVEVTEGTILDKPGDPRAALQALHDAGVRIALDDFGTGYASLVHLKEIPVDTLKIDRSFIAGLMRPGDESEEIVRAVLALGHGLNKTVIAEGVETPVQLERLRELGCDFAQGYLFGRPAPAIARADSLQAAA